MTRDPERFLLLPALAMRAPSRVVVLSLLVSLISLGLAVYSTTSSRAEAPPARVSSLSAARFFVLLPDGRVEITDAWSRRVFRWDGQRWQQSESGSAAHSDSR